MIRTHQTKLEILETKCELQYDYIIQGAITRLRAAGHELGKNSNKYFFNLESSRGKGVELERYCGGVCINFVVALGILKYLRYVVKQIFVFCTFRRNAMFVSKCLDMFFGVKLFA